MTRALLILALMLGGCVGTNVVLPPTQYDHEPTVPYLDIRMSVWKIDNACRTFHVKRWNGCWVYGNPALRIVPNDLPALKVAAIIRHENAHGNGWPADHPGGHY